VHPRQIRQFLREGRRVYATQLTAPSPWWPRAMKQLPIDFVFVDTEHVPHDRHQLSWICQTLSAIDLPPVVRIPSPDPYEACKALDGGAAGIIVPYVETAEQVKQLIGATRLRPLKGERLEQALSDHHVLEPPLRDYLNARNADTIVIINIESAPAMDRLADLVSIPGIDAVMIGPHDLTCSLGIPEQYDHPRFDEAVRTIYRVARQHNVGAGIHFWVGTTQEIAWCKAGGNLVIHSNDLMSFQKQLRAEINEIRSALGDDASEGSMDTQVV
jgi:2-keto-3-deoxy-L-rhamnonate aldolase RhmA